MPDIEGMNASKLSSQQSRAECWRRLLQQQEASGQSVHVFCAERGLTEQTFYNWRKRLEVDAPASFALVRTETSAESSPGCGLQLDLGAGQRLLIPSGVDPATLRTVLTVLRERI